MKLDTGTRSCARYGGISPGGVSGGAGSVCGSVHGAERASRRVEYRRGGGGGANEFTTRRSCGHVISDYVSVSVALLSADAGPMKGTRAFSHACACGHVPVALGRERDESEVFGLSLGA